MGDDVIALFGELRTMTPHIHLPIQSGCDSVLKRMNRSYNTKRYSELVRKLRKVWPGISITTDIIVGFCGETEKEFQKTCVLMWKLKIDSAFISKYSERKGTLAARTLKDDVPFDVKKEREVKMTEVFCGNSREYLQKFAGQTVRVLVDKVEKGWASGRIPEFKPCRFPSDDVSLIGRYADVRVERCMEWALEGKLFNSTI
jgi:tRNA-2-methylthio-N6-dimethylallyladenosine synthase